MFRPKVVGTFLAALLSMLALAVAASAGNSPAAHASVAARRSALATSMIIPAGKTATLSGAEFGNIFGCPLDPLAYGYQLNGGTNVQVATGSGCVNVAGATIGPVGAPTLLRIWLTDSYGPVYTFYSDGNHALVSGTRTPAGLLPPWTVSIDDSFLGTCGPSCPRPPAGPGLGNFNVTVSIS